MPAKKEVKVFRIATNFTEDGSIKGSPFFVIQVSLHHMQTHAPGYHLRFCPGPTSPLNS